MNVFETSDAHDDPAGTAQIAEDCLLTDILNWESIERILGDETRMIYMPLADRDSPEQFFGRSMQ